MQALSAVGPLCQPLHATIKWKAGAVGVQIANVGGRFMTFGWGRRTIIVSVLVVAMGLLVLSPTSAQDNRIDILDLDPPPAGVTLGAGVPDQPDGEAFRVGFLADAAPGHQRALYRPYRDYLEQVLQRPVEFVPFRDARGLVLAMQRESISYAMAPGSVFAATHRLCDCVSALATQPNRDGSIGLFSALLVANLPDAPRDLGDVDGTKLGVLGEGSVVAHRVGMAELWRAELRLPDDQVGFVPSIDEAHRLLVTGEIQAVLTWTRQADGATLFDREPFASLSDEARSQLRLLWRSRPIPAFTHYIHRSVPEDERSVLQDGLVALTGRDGDAFDAIDLGSGRGFESVEISDFEPYLDAYTYWDQVSQE